MIVAAISALLSAAITVAIRMVFESASFLNERRFASWSAFTPPAAAIRARPAWIPAAPTLWGRETALVERGCNAFAGCYPSHP